MLNIPIGKTIYNNDIYRLGGKAQLFMQHTSYGKKAFIVFQSDKAPFDVTLTTAFFNNHHLYVTPHNDKSIFAYSLPRRYIKITVRIYKILNLKVVFMTFKNKCTYVYAILFAR